MVRVLQTRPEMLAAALRQTKPETWERLMETIAETWIKKGKADGKIDTFLRLSRLKFGDLSPQHVEAVQTASVAQLDHWLEALISDRTPDDIFTTSHSS